MTEVQQVAQRARTTYMPQWHRLSASTTCDINCNTISKEHNFTLTLAPISTLSIRYVSGFEPMKNVLTISFLRSSEPAIRTLEDPSASHPVLE